MARRLEFVGGPLDGIVSGTARRGAYLWAQGVQLRGRDGVLADRANVYGAAGAGRHLYRALERDVYLWADNTHALCPGCNVLHGLDSHSCCQLCGAFL